MRTPETEEQAVENVRQAIQDWRKFQASQDPLNWNEGTVGDFMVVAVAQFIDGTGALHTSNCFFTPDNQPKYRTLGLMAVADEMVEDAYERE